MIVRRDPEEEAHKMPRNDDLSKPGNDDFYGLGRVNALRAVLQE